MDESGTVFYLQARGNNRYAAEIIQDPANRDRRCLVPGISSEPVLRIGLDQRLKNPPYLARFGRRGHNDVILNRRFSRNDQCYFDFNKDTGELLLHDLSEKNDTELFDITDRNRLGQAQIWKTPRQCVVVLAYDHYNKCDRKWIFRMRDAEFLLIPPRMQGQDEARCTSEKLAFAGQADPERTYEGTMQQLMNLGLQSLRSEALKSTYMPASTATFNPHNTRFRTPLEPEEHNGDVHKVVDMYTGAHYACKIVAVRAEVPQWRIHSEKEFRASVETEVDLVKRVDHHEHIVPYSHIQGFKIGQNIEIFMPVYEGSLHGLIERYRPKEPEPERDQPESPPVTPELRAMTDRMLSQILSALDFVHTQDPPIIHRDIKPANILYQGSQADKFLLTDFGIAKVADTSRTMLGTKWYAAPEVQSGGEQTPKVDIYELGATVVECLVRLPDEAKRSEMMQHWSQWHRHMQALLNQHGAQYASMLADDANDRPTARILLDDVLKQPTRTTLQTTQPNAICTGSGASPQPSQANGATMMSPAPSVMDWTRTIATAALTQQGERMEPSQPSPVAAQPPEAPPIQPARPRARRGASVKSIKSARSAECKKAM
ncbi:kinase-like protein [Cercophora scortea]|uniref:non-specific serine/threonine protein kinase n=1 Tax=Cercophora scortea TaxID=314031 RepID=A0AAE0MI99_9PEZI|nr:kinase-like protein [Cercophora scortea]